MRRRPIREPSRGLHFFPPAPRLALVAAIAGTGPLSMTGCGDGTSPVTVAAVRVVPSSSTLIMEQTLGLEARVEGSNGRTLTDRPIAWTSSNTAVASVNATGTVLGVATGAVTISATVEGVSGTAAVNVVPKPVATVTVMPANPSITVGQTVQLMATARASDGSVLTGRTAAWRSSGESFAAVSPTGMVTGMGGSGTARIFADVEGVVGMTDVQVTARPVTGSWTGTLTMAYGTHTVAYVLTDTGGVVTGTNTWTFYSIVDVGSVAGTRNGNAMTLTTTFPALEPVTFIGTLALDGRSIKGYLTGSGFFGTAFSIGRSDGVPAPTMNEPRFGTRSTIGRQP